MCVEPSGFVMVSIVTEADGRLAVYEPGPDAAAEPVRKPDSGWHGLSVFVCACASGTLAASAASVSNSTVAARAREAVGTERARRWPKPVTSPTYASDYQRVNAFVDTRY